MRNKRFIAAHRGGPLSADHHRLLAQWAADCAEHVLILYETECHDHRPRNAIEAARAWAAGNVRVGVAQKAAVAAHAAAREANNPAAIAAARSAGHAVATAHFAEHSFGAVIYALKAVLAVDRPIQEETAWQISRIPEPVRDLVISGLKQRLPKAISISIAITGKPQT